MSKQTIDAKWGEASPVHDPYVLAHFSARPTDVLITTAPKAGTTWMQQILHQCRTGGDTEFDSIFQAVPWLELPQEGKSWREVLDQFEMLNDPRIFKTHCTFEQTPGFGTVKIILTSRDPRDCCVSFFHHVMNMTPAAREKHGVTTPETFAEYFNEWMSFGSWYRNIKSWWPHFNHERLLWLRYEDMLQDLSYAIDRITGFLDWRLATENRARVIEYSSFQWMKEHTEKFDRTKSSESSFKPNSFIRKGQVGNHKQLMNGQQEKNILQVARDTLAPDCIEFLGLA